MSHETIDGYRVHWMAAAAALLEGEELEALVESIRRDGLQEPIVYRVVGRNEWEILDGRNRLLACLAADVGPRWRCVDLNDEQAERFVEAAHCRRHESKSAKALRAYRWLPRYGNVQAAARACGVSPELVRQLARLHDAAADDPAAEVLIELVESGRCPASTAHKALRDESVDVGEFVDRLTSSHVSPATALREVQDTAPEAEAVSDEAIRAWVGQLDAVDAYRWVEVLARAVLGPSDAGETRTLLRRAVEEAQ